MRFFLVFALIVVSTLPTFCQQSRTPPFLMVTTKLSVKEKPADDYRIILMYEGKKRDSVIVKNDVKRYVIYERNKVYTVYYKKAGEYDKCLIIDTRVPDKIPEKAIYKLSIKVELDPEYSNMKEDAVDFPSAIIKYDEKTKNFEYAKEYHKQVHK